MTDISSDQMEAIIGDSIAFIRSITNVYGSEKGMELWETIADTIDPVIKGKVFFAILTGTHEDRVTFWYQQDRLHQDYSAVYRLWVGRGQECI